MTDTYNAERAVFPVSGKDVEAFMLPNGDYGFSQASAAKALNKDESDSRKYIAGKASKALASGDLTAGSPTRYAKVGRTRIRLLTESEVAEYWMWKADNGCIEAKALVAALVSESLTRRADAAFGVKKTESQYEEQTTKLRLELIDRLSAQFDLGGKSEFYGQLTDAEQEIGLLKVNIKRYEELLADDDQWLMAPKYRDSLKECQAELDGILATLTTTK
ncbi:MAG: hypothetical protein RM021_011850 [Nostoc sp. EkiNYC01]|nr:hypothetical protein [Nostoc sp. EkiNYC01]